MYSFFNWIKQRLNSWDEICSNELLRLRTNNIFAKLLTCLISFFMLVINFLLGKHSMIPFLFIISLLYGILFFIQLISPAYQRWSAILFGIMALIMCLVFLFTGDSSGIGFLWIFMLPPIAVMVVPLKDSIYYNAFLLICVTLSLNTSLQNFICCPYNRIFNIQFPIALLSVTACIYLAESIRILTQNRLQDTAKQLSSFAFTDPLTGIYNRHALSSHFGDILTANAKGLSFAIIDLDYFKTVNDTYGHLVGDEMLKHVVTLIQTVIPPNALLYRWGGEEFLLILKTINQQEVWQVWKDIRCLVESTPLQSETGAISSTLSIGGHCAREELTIHQCIEIADEHLYKAKCNGRNCIVCSNPPSTADNT